MNLSFYRVRKLLSTFNNCPDISSLKKLHACIITWGLQTDTSFSSKLIVSYANFDYIDKSKWVFDTITNTTGSDISLLNSLLVGYFRAGHLNQVLLEYKRLRHCCTNIGLDGVETSVTLCLKACIQLGSYDLGRGVHGDCVKLGLSVNPFVGSSFIRLYSQYGDIRDCWKVFDEMPERDVVVYTSMISGCVQSGDCSVYEIFDVVRDMFRQRLDPNRVTLVCLLQAAAQSQAVKVGCMIHGYAVRRGIGCLDEVFETSLMDMYIKCGDLRKARCLSGMLNKKSAGSWNALIVGYFQNGQPLEALKLFGSMVGMNIRPDLIVLGSAFMCCADLKALREGKSVHGYVIRNGIMLDLVATTSLVDMYCKFKDLVRARTLFDGVDKDVALYNVIMAGYLLNESACKAVRVFVEMLLNYIKPNVGSILSILSALSDLKDSRRGKCVHGYVLRHELDMTKEISNQLINVYAKCGHLPYARQVFIRIKCKDLLSWTSMMKAYIYNEKADEAVILFRIMKNERLDLDSVLSLSLLQALSQLGCLSLVKEAHCYLYRARLDRETAVINSLITIYAHCGRLDMARSLFEHMNNRCLTSWNSMIAAYGMHGLGTEALGIFERMKRTNIQPDDITFTSILTACSHSGLVDEGLQAYKSMTEEYCIVPKEEHYACMVDLLGRAGRLEEAYDLVQCVPPRYSGSALVSLLAACRVHGDRKMGEVIGRLILDREPENSSAYSLVSNLFAEGGKWNEAVRIRTMASDKGIKMTSGYSRIEQ